MARGFEFDQATCTFKDIPDPEPEKEWLKREPYEPTELQRPVPEEPKKPFEPKRKCTRFLSNSEIEEEKKDVQKQIDEIRGNMTPGELSRTTYGIAKVKNKSGTKETWISQAGKKGYVPPRIREGRKVVINKLPEGTSENRLNDAEQTLMREAKEQKSEILALGATRDMCGKCQNAAKEQGLIDRVATPLKKLNAEEA